ncbi:hypothetical protein GCM10023331_28650 [Algivirga pacifica]|uniref:Prenyltransferase n=2 Tax=Algivirga pacifica TaxID=1162670 RepID=A0ABP9DDY5_9BACT
MDQDTDSIGGVEHPPLPPKELFWITILLDTVAIGLTTFFLGLLPALLLVGYILASRAYSARSIRLKKYPIGGFSVVFFFQGFYTFLMVYMAVSGLSLTESLVNCWMPALTSSLMIGGAYPLSQIYQHQQDRENGDISLSSWVGYKGTFMVSLCSFFLANLLLGIYFLPERAFFFMVFQVGMLPTMLFFVYWMRKVWQDTSAANFKNTMRMNLLAAVSMNLTYGAMWWLSV